MFQKNDKKDSNKNTWGGNRKSDIDFKLETTAVRIPKRYHRLCQEYAQRLEQQDIENGTIVQDDNGKWVYKG